MATEPAAPQPDEKDWTWVLARPCPECGFDAAALDLAELPAVVRGTVDDFRVALHAPHAEQRRADQVWSTLEYGCHVRDACRIFHQRLGLMLTEDDPLFDNWDQDETAVAERYWAQTPSVVADELEVAGYRIAHSFAEVDDAQWDRPGRRANGSTFTVESLGRYFTHDLVHHVHDIGT